MNASNIVSISALTPIQEGILFHVIREPDRRAYHSQFCATLDGPVDIELWEQAWHLTIARHDTLRTLFTWEGRDKPLQIVREQVELPWQVLDWQGSDGAEIARLLRDLLERDRDLGFDLERAPLVRCFTIKTGARAQRFVLSFHHLILDGWSMRLVLADAQRLYAQLAQGNTPDPAQAPSFTRFVEWQAEQDSAAHDAFWREQLGDFVAPVFPGTNDGTTGVTDTHNVVDRSPDTSLSERLKDYSRTQRVTLSSTISAAWALLLQRYTGENDVVFGATVAGRPPQLDGVEAMAGMFINTLPLRVNVDDAQAVNDYVAHVHARQVALRSVEHSPLARVTRCSGVAPGSPLFESIVVFENFPAAEAQTDTPAFTLTLDDFVEYSHFPLALLVVPDETLRLILVSDPQRVNDACAQDMLNNFIALLHALVAGTSATVGQLDACDAAQRHTLIHELNDTHRDTAAVTPLWDQIVARSEAEPERIATVDGEITRTYAELIDRARRVASGIIDAGVKTGTPIAIMAPRDADAVAGVLGILAAGCAYVPLSMRTPPARTTKILADLAQTQDEVVVIIGHDCAVPGTFQTLSLGQLLTTRYQATRTSAPDDLAYVIYTSGSTGAPKGVAVSQRNLYHSVDARDHYYRDAPDAFALLSTLATDSSVAGLFWTLGRGGTLVLPQERAEQDMPALLELLRAQSVTHLLTVPSLYALLLEHLDDAPLAALRVAIVAGEACPTALVSEHAQQQTHTTLHNEYGPTEATVWCSAARLHAGLPITIGGPIANTRLYVVDADLRPVPIGVAGELCIGGAQVAQGYLGDAPRTAEYFVASPFVEGDRLYRTGDRARWQRDGTLAFIGRVDAQIKVRGFRVEPGDIEACIEAVDGVNEAVVVLHQAPGSSTSPRLVAWLHGHETTAASALREHMATQLPAYMVPQHLEWIDALPRNAAGKADRLALAIRPLQTPSGNASVEREEHSPVEQALLDIWREVLGTEAISKHDDFFALGGDSLLSIRILARAGKAGLVIAPKEFFANPTVAALARCAKSTSTRRVKQTPVIGAQALMPIQRWFFKRITRGAEHWNMSWCFELHATISQHTLQRALAAVVTHHDALRSRFEQTNGKWHATLDAAQEFDVVSQLDLRQTDHAELTAAVHAHADILNTQFDLSAAPLLRLCLIRTATTLPDRVLIIAHHLIVDAESWRIVIEDLCLALDQLARGDALALPAKTDSMITWAARLDAWAQEEALLGVAQQWTERLAKMPPPLVSAALSPEQVVENTVRYRDIALTDADTHALLDAATTTRASMQETLLAAVAGALARHTQRDAVCIELEGHGREALFDDVDISRTVGWMTTAYPLVVQDPGLGTDISATLRAAKSALRDVPHNGLSYSLLMHADLDNPSLQTLRGIPRAQVLLNYLGKKQHAEHGLLRLCDDRCGQARAADAPRAYLLEINAYLDDNALHLNLAAPRAALTDADLDGLEQALVAHLQDMGGATTHTAVPQDFPLANLDQQALSDLSTLLDDLDDVD